jgi:UDP-2-acetamido-3-amino-2,3-dideoxy-glucuronate N-acetyltransferase
LGPSCVFTNVERPRAFVDHKGQFAQTIVRRGASIGANATIVCPAELGRYCLVGAGAVVTGDVEPFSLVVGAPARRIGWVCVCGERLRFDQDAGTVCATCQKCSRRFECVDEAGRQRVKPVDG